MNIKKCIIPLAGKGTRRLPITKTISKEMLPVLDKPTIMLLVEECLQSGIEEIIFVVNKDNYSLIKDFFSEKMELQEFLKNSNKNELLKDVNSIIEKIKFHYVYQDENIRGTSGAIYAAREYINNEYFAVMFGDDLIESNKPFLKDLIEEAKKYHCNVLGVREVEEKYKNYYYVIKYKEDNIMHSFVKNNLEKNKASNDMMLGRMVLNSNIFDKLLVTTPHEKNEYYLPDAIVLLNEEIRTVKCNGNYYNIGNVLGFVKANIAYGLKNDKIKEELLDFINNEINK